MVVPLSATGVSALYVLLCLMRTLLSILMPHLSVSCFFVHNMYSHVPAPSSRIDAAGNAVHSPVKKIGPVEIPSFLVKAFGMDRPLYHTEPDFSTIEEECYLGKDGNLDECADFDPPASKP